MKRVLAVSGGVDSMVMMDMLCREFPVGEILVAHFDHGIRENSHEDAEFVEREAKARGLKFMLGEGRLGAGTSEEAARKARYEFLSRLGGTIYTAHHLDDVVESIAINLMRGTGWRGIAVLDGDYNGVEIVRPLIEAKMTKKDVYKYAAEHDIPFRLDQTNNDNTYLRNRLREKIMHERNISPVNIMPIYEDQKRLKRDIENVVNTLIADKNGCFERAWFTEMDDKVALELLRESLRRTGVAATNPQLMDFLEAIRTYKSGKYFNLPGDRLIRINKKDFCIKSIQI